MQVSNEITPFIMVTPGYKSGGCKSADSISFQQNVDKSGSHYSSEQSLSRLFVMHKGYSVNRGRGTVILLQGSAGSRCRSLFWPDNLSLSCPFQAVHRLCRLRS